jgi:hypothetical protein
MRYMNSSIVGISSFEMIARSLDISKIPTKFTLIQESKDSVGCGAWMAGPPKDSCWALEGSWLDVCNTMEEREA